MSEDLEDSIDSKIEEELHNIFDKDKNFESEVQYVAKYLLESEALHSRIAHRRQPERLHPSNGPHQIYAQHASTPSPWNQVLTHLKRKSPRNL